MPTNANIETNIRLNTLNNILNNLPEIEETSMQLKASDLFFISTLSFLIEKVGISAVLDKDEKEDLSFVLIDMKARFYRELIQPNVPPTEDYFFSISVICRKHAIAKVRIAQLAAEQKELS